MLGGRRASVGRLISVHECSHAPQLRSSFETSTQRPSQTVIPGGQPHLPRTQATPGAHSVPHAPQLFGSSLVFASQPSSVMPLQSA